MVCPRYKGEGFRVMLFVARRKKRKKDEKEMLPFETPPF